MATLADFGQTQKVTTRNADNIVAEQDRVAALNNQQRLSQVGNAEPVDPNAKPISTTPISTIYNTPPAGQTQLPPSTGKIQDSERERLRKAGFTDEEILKREQDLKPAIQDTMTNTGLGTTFDQQGRTVAGSGRLDAGTTRLGQDPNAALNAKREADKKAEIGNTKGYVTKTYVDQYGNVQTYTVEDPGATENARNEAKNRQAAEDAAAADRQRSAQEARTQNPEGKTTGIGDETPQGEDGTVIAPTAPAFNPNAPNLNSFISTLPPEQQAQAQAIFGPIMDYIGTQQGLMGQQFQNGMGALDEFDDVFKQYMDSQRAQNQSLFDRYDGFFKDQLENQLYLAERTRDAEERTVESERARQEIQFERAMRDQMITNEKNRADNLTGLGVSGGWRSSRHAASVYHALAKGDRILGDLHVDKALAGEYWANKMLGVQDTYHANVTAAHDQYKSSSLTLLDKVMTRAQELDKTIFDHTKDRIDAISKLKSEYITGIGDLAKTYASTISAQNKWVIQQAADAKKAEWEQGKQLWGEAMQYVDRYGTQNKAALGAYEKQLGLPAGTLSNQRTLAELRMAKSGGGGGGGGGVASGGISDLVKKERQRLLAVYPNASPAQLDNIAFANIYNLYNGDSAAGQKTMRQVYDFMMDNRIGNSNYAITTHSPTSAIGKESYENYNQLLNDQEAIAIGGEEAAMNIFADEERFGTDQEALDYLAEIGWVPNYGLNSWFDDSPDSFTNQE